MRLDNAQLAAFAAVLAEGSFDAAARRLHVTPSAISQRIKWLEERMGQILVQRSRPCQPTAAGRVLWRYAQEMALRESEVLAELGLTPEAPATPPRLPVAVNADSLDGWLAPLFSALAAEPGFSVELRAEDQDHSLALLREGQVMAAISASAVSVQGCRVEPLGVMRYLALAAPAFCARHFAAGVDAASLARAPMLMFNAKDGLQAAFIARVCGSADLRPPIYTLPSTRSFQEAACRGLAWGMMPESMVAPALADGSLVQIAPAHWLDVPLYWHRWRVESPALARLTALVHAAAATALRKPDIDDKEHP